MLRLPHYGGGVFAQRGHGANYYSVYPGNTPEKHPPIKACMLDSKNVQLKHIVFSTSHLSRNMHWNQHIWVPCVQEHMKIYQGLPRNLVVENSQLFTQRTVRPPRIKAGQCYD